MPLQERGCQGEAGKWLWIFKAFEHFVVGPVINIKAILSLIFIIPSSECLSVCIIKERNYKDSLRISPVFLPLWSMPSLDLHINRAASWFLLYSLSALYLPYSSPNANASIAAIKTIPPAIDVCKVGERSRVIWVCVANRIHNVTWPNRSCDKETEGYCGVPEPAQFMLYFLLFPIFDTFSDDFIQAFIFCPLVILFTYFMNRL